MNIKELLSNPKIRGLSPSSFKAYLVLIEKAGPSKIISNFTIRGQAKEWGEDKNLNLISSKNTMKVVLDELEHNRLIKLNLEGKELRIL